MCDEITNVEACQFDGGDCCLAKKSTPLCQICTCKMKIDQQSLETDLASRDVKKFVTISKYNSVLIEEDVVSILDVESVDVCSTLCLKESNIKKKVNGWKFHFETQKCSCSFLKTTLCMVIEGGDLKSYDKIGNEFISGFVMLSKTLDCGNK